MSWITALGAMIVLAMCLSSMTKDPWWEEPCRRGALQQKGREKKGGDTDRACFPSMHPVSSRCGSQVWMKSLVGCLASPCFPLTPLSLSHGIIFCRAATDNSRRVTCCSVTGSTFCYEYVWKDRKSLPALCLSLSKWTLTLLACMWGLG